MKYCVNNNNNNNNNNKPLIRTQFYIIYKIRNKKKRINILLTYRNDIIAQ